MNPMRTAFFLAAVGLAGSAIAQIPLPPFGSTFTSTLTRGFWFQAPASGIVAGLSVPNEALQPFQVVEFIDLGAAPPPAYPSTVVGTQLFYSNNTPGGSTIPTAIPIIAGNYYGVLGACTSAVGSTTSYNSYAAVAGPFTSNILGIPTTLTRFGTQFGIGAGGNQPCWQESAGALSRVDVTIAPSGGGVIATNTTTGQGCIRSYASVYENFGSPASFDLGSTSMSMVPSGGGYIVIPGLYPYVPPTATATPVAVGDDVEQTVPFTGSFAYPGGTTSAFTVCSNGFVSTGTGNGASFTPDVTTMLGFAQTAWGGWHDYYPVGGTSGNVKFEQVGNVVYITWDAVVDFGSTTPNTWQLQFDLSSGIVTFVWGSMSLLGNAQLVFYSPAGPSANPGSSDLSVAVPGGGITLGTTDIVPLTLAGTSRPVTGTNWGLGVSNIPATGTIGIDIFGLADPGLNDLGFLGAPGCGIRASLDFLGAWIVAGSTHNYSLAIPNNPALYNVHVYTTSAVLQPGVNTFLGGVITANGIDGNIGNL